MLYVLIVVELLSNNISMFFEIFNSILNVENDIIYNLHFTKIPDIIYVNNIEFTALSICISEFIKFIKKFPPYPRAAIFG